VKPKGEGGPPGTRADKVEILSVSRFTLSHFPGLLGGESAIRHDSNSGQMKSATDEVRIAPFIIMAQIV